ncbi:hypothetical protein GGI35DRAFT_488217 [Trichoderma velutinum]
MEFNSENIHSESPGISEIIKATECCSQSNSSMLDFDVPALIGSPAPSGSGLNTQSLCFNSELSFLDDQSTSFTPLPLPSQISATNDAAKIDDIGLFHSILYRLDSIEEAVGSANSQIHQFNSTFTFLMSKLTSSEDIFVAIKDLKQSMKWFVNAILNRILGKALEQEEETLDVRTQEEV